MRLKDLDEFASIIGEGFLADKILKGERVASAISFVVDISIGREIVKSNNFNYLHPIFSLRRYNWFLEWLIETHGNVKCESKEEADRIINEKISNLKDIQSEDSKSFWKWVSRKSLDICSGMIS